MEHTGIIPRGMAEDIIEAKRSGFSKGMKILTKQMYGGRIAAIFLWLNRYFYDVTI